MMCAMLPCLGIELYSRKNLKREVEDILFWNHTSSWNFRFVTLPLDIPVKTSFHPWEFCTTLENSKVKYQDPWIFLIILSWTPLKIPLASFLIDPWNFYMLVQYLWRNFHVPTPFLQFRFFLEQPIATCLQSYCTFILLRHTYTYLKVRRAQWYFWLNNTTIYSSVITGLFQKKSKQQGWVLDWFGFGWVLQTLKFI